MIYWKGRQFSSLLDGFYNVSVKSFPLDFYLDFYLRLSVRRRGAFRRILLPLPISPRIAAPVSCSMPLVCARLWRIAMAPRTLLVASRIGDVTDVTPWSTLGTLGGEGTGGRAGSVRSTVGSPDNPDNRNKVTPNHASNKANAASGRMNLRRCPRRKIGRLLAEALPRLRIPA